MMPELNDGAGPLSLGESRLDSLMIGLYNAANPQIACKSPTCLENSVPHYESR